MLEPAEVTATVDADGSCAFSMARITTTPYKENVAFLRLAVVPVDVLDGPKGEGDAPSAVGHRSQASLPIPAPLLVGEVIKPSNIRD